MGLFLRGDAETDTIFLGNRTISKNLPAKFLMKIYPQYQLEQNNSAAQAIEVSLQTLHKLFRIGFLTTIILYLNLLWKPLALLDMNTFFPY